MENRAHPVKVALCGKLAKRHTYMKGGRRGWYVGSCIHLSRIVWPDLQISGFLYHCIDVQKAMG